MVDKLATNIGPLALGHPVINASGTYDLLEADRVIGGGLIAECPFAAYVPKTVTLEPRDGNPPPRLYETSAGLLNSIGLANKGIEAFIEDDLPGFSELNVPLIISVAGSRVDDYRDCVKLLDEHRGVDAIELNVSCPNVELDGMALGCSPERTRDATAMAREYTDKPLLVKLTPNVTDIVATARAAVDGGTDAISAINTVHGMALDPWTLKPALGHITGGLSGPAIKPIALRAIYLISAELDVPVVAMGGVTTAIDVLEFLAAGASAVAIGTASFRDPRLAEQLADELTELMAQRGIVSVADLVGSAHRA